MTQEQTDQDATNKRTIGLAALGTTATLLLVCILPTILIAATLTAGTQWLGLSLWIGIPILIASLAIATWHLRQRPE